MASSSTSTVATTTTVSPSSSGAGLVASGSTSLASTIAATTHTSSTSSTPPSSAVPMSAILELIRSAVRSGSSVPASSVAPGLPVSAPTDPTVAGASTASTMAGTTMPGAASISSIPLFSTAGFTPPTLTGPASTSSDSTSGDPWTSLASFLSLADKPSLGSGPSTSTSVPPVPSVPLVLSAALPPVPAKIVEKITQGQFVDFKDLLADNIALQKRLNEVGIHTHFYSPTGRLREVQDPLTWVSCFLAFMAARIEDKETRSLAAYGMIVIHLARKHGGRGWLAYDSLFRQQVSAGAKLDWAELCPSLMAATVLGASGGEPGRVCSLCMASDHVTSECALHTLETGRTFSGQPTVTPIPNPMPSLPAGSYRPPLQLPPAKAAYRFRPYQAAMVPPAATPEICRRFNRGLCQLNPCKYDHTCSGCNKPGHPLIECPTKGKGKATAPPAK